MTKIDEELKIERATNNGARSELVRKDRMLSRIQAIWDEEVYGMTPMVHDTQTDGTTSEQVTTQCAPTGLPYVSVILDADTDDYMVSHTTSLTVDTVLTRSSQVSPQPPTATGERGRIGRSASPSRGQKICPNTTWHPTKLRTESSDGA